MQFAIDDKYLPVTLTAPPMTDQEFARFCAEYPDYFIEATAEGEIVIAPPNYTLISVRNGEIYAQLEAWASRDGRGALTGASAGFVLPNGARRSADAAWTLKSRVLALDPASLHGYWHLCPDFIIELRSQSDRLPVLQAKMREWIQNGAQLAWLIDPDRRAVEIYRPGRETEARTGADCVVADSPVDGFILDLRPVWEPLSL